MLANLHSLIILRARDAETKEVRLKDRKGRHTTTAREMI